MENSIRILIILSALMLCFSILSGCKKDSTDTDTEHMQTTESVDVETTSNTTGLDETTGGDDTGDVTLVPEPVDPNTATDDDCRKDIFF